MSARRVSRQRSRFGRAVAHYLQGVGREPPVEQRVVGVVRPVLEAAVAGGVAAVAGVVVPFGDKRFSSVKQLGEHVPAGDLGHVSGAVLDDVGQEHLRVEVLAVVGGDRVVRRRRVL